MLAGARDQSEFAAVRRRGDIPGALAAYAAHRLVRTARVQLSSRSIGEHVYHPGGAHALLRNQIMQAKSSSDWYDTLSWLYGGPDPLPADGATAPVPARVA